MGEKVVVIGEQGISASTTPKIKSSVVIMGLTAQAVVQSGVTEDYFPTVYGFDIHPR